MYTDEAAFEATGLLDTNAGLTAQEALGGGAEGMGIAGFATPVVAEAVFFQIGDGIVATLAFIFGITHQNDLSRSQSYIVVVAVIAVVALLLTTAMRFLRDVVEGRSTHFIKRPNVAALLIKLIYVTVAYLIGLLSRIASDLVTAAPRVGFFGLVTLTKPFIIVVLTTTFLFEMQMLHGERQEISQRMEHAIKQIQIKAQPAPTKPVQPPTQQPTK